MTTELRVRNQSQQLYVRAIHSAYRNGVQLYDPSIWLTRDPEAQEKMLRDADISHAVGFRKHLIAGRQWDLLPKKHGSDKSLGALAVDVGMRLLGDIDHFTAARLELAGAFLHGQRFARIHGETRVETLGDGKPRTWWFPRRLEDLDKRSRRIVAHNDGKQIVAKWQAFDFVRGDWFDESARDAIDIIAHTYQDSQATLGYGKGLLDAIGWWWYAKEHVFAESLQACERLAQGIVAAKIDGARDATTGKPNTQLISDWQRVLENMRARHVLVYDSNDQIEVIQTSGEGHQLLKDIRDELRTTLHTLILGANLTTSADSGGSYALAEVQENSTEALIQFDTETLEESITKGLLGSVWWHNWANLAELGLLQEKPRFNIRQQKKLDPQVRANVAKTAHEMGLPLSKEELYEQIGFRKPQKGEEVLEGAAAMSPMAPFGGSATAPFGSFGVGSGFGSLPS